MDWSGGPDLTDLLGGRKQRWKGVWKKICWAGDTIGSLYHTKAKSSVTRQFCYGFVAAAWNACMYAYMDGV